MKKQRRMAYIFLTLIMMITVALSGCGEKGNENSSLTDQTSGSAQTPTVASPLDTAALKDSAQVSRAEGFQAADETVYTTERVNIRETNSTQASSLGLLEAGTALHRIGFDPIWSQVEYNGNSCFVATKYLTTDPNGISAADTGSTEPSVTSLAVSEEPATTSPTVTPTEQPATVPATAASSEAGQNNGDVPAVPATSGAFEGDLANIDNTHIPWGYNVSDRDEWNRPNGSLYFQRLYGYYADFIGSNSKTIYLTMDEGYEAGHTPAILDTLKEKNVKAVFFLTKQFLDMSPELVQRMIDEGHILGNHTKTHPAEGMPSYSLEQQKEDVMWVHNFVKEHYGYDMKLFRYPSGDFSKQSLALINSLGYRPVFWSFAHKDWIVDQQPDPTASLQTCLDQLHPGAIYLLHAVSATNTQILGDFIDGARARGYEFGTYPVQ